MRSTRLSVLFTNFKNGVAILNPSRSSSISDISSFSSLSVFNMGSGKCECSHHRVKRNLARTPRAWIKALAVDRHKAESRGLLWLL